MYIITHLWVFFFFFFFFNYVYIATQNLNIWYTQTQHLKYYYRDIELSQFHMQCLFDSWKKTGSCQFRDWA